MLVVVIIFCLKKIVEWWFYFYVNKMIGYVLNYIFNEKNNKLIDKILDYKWSEVVNNCKILFCIFFLKVFDCIIDLNWMFKYFIF